MKKSEMTGRDLIIYILENGLEDTPIFEYDSLIGFMPIEKAAAECGTGIETMEVMYLREMMSGFKIGDQIYILAKDVESFKKC